MKIILQRSVDGLGDPGDVVTVKGGYARNYLIPQGMAVVATRGGARHAESLKASHDGRVAKLKGAAEEAASKVSGQRITVTAKAGEDGKLFGSVTAEAVAAAVSSATGVATIEKRSVHIDEPIKHVGEHVVRVQLHPDVSAEVTVEVVAE